MSNPTDKSGTKSSPGAAVRSLVRKALKAALATLEPETGEPYASLVAVATSPAGEPVLLLSDLAVHTRNLKADSRVSLMIDGTDAAGDPLAGGRVSLMGTIEATRDPVLRSRYLARHREAEMYASFADFSFYRMQVARAHFVGGFGRIVDLTSSDVLISTHGAEDLISAAEEICAHMNKDHADALAIYAAAARNEPPVDGAWRMTGIDPEGLDLIGPGAAAARIVFQSPIAGPGDARRALAALAAEARTALANKPI